MTLALAVAIFSVAAGAAVGLVRGGDVFMGPVRTFALVAAVAVVLSQLLPDALQAVGMPAFLVFAAGLGLPVLLERLGPFALKDRLPRPNFSLELGYFGLIWHKVGDGLGLGAYTSDLHADHLHADVLFAIGAHTVPVTALVVLAFTARGGPRAGVVRAIGLALATVVGVLIAGTVPIEAAQIMEPWVAAAVAGLLLHVVAHDWQPSEGPTTTRRLLELVAIATGLGLAFISGGHHHGAHDAGPGIRTRAGEAFVDLTLDTAPTLLFGLAIGAALQLYGDRIPVRWLRSGNPFRQAVRGAVVGAPLPICACGVLPVAQSLRDRGGTAPLVVAFLLATPELGVETFALTVRFLGWEFAGIRLVAAVGVAIAAALLVARHAGHRDQAPLETTSADLGGLVSDAPSGPSSWRRFLGHLDELLFHVGPWTLVGLIAAAFVEAVLPADSLGGIATFGLDIFVVSAIAIPSYVCAASATPLAAILLAKGLSPGAVLAGLLLGPATNIATVGFLRNNFGGKAAFAVISGLLIATWLTAGSLNAVPMNFQASAEAIADHAHGPVAYVGTGVLLLLVIRAIWREGLRTWLGSLGEGLGTHAHHGHDHGHGHDHDHDHE